VRALSADTRPIHFATFTDDSGSIVGAIAVRPRDALPHRILIRQHHNAHAT
jgi:hypothetical protein